MTDPHVLPSATTLRFAVLVLLVVATTGSAYGYLGLVAHRGADESARECMSGVSMPDVHRGDPQATSVVLACTIEYAPVVTVWSLAGIALVTVLSVLLYALMPWWTIRVTRTWLPLRRSGTPLRWNVVRPWWVPGRPQRSRPLNVTYPREREMAIRVAELAGRIGLTAMPGCLINPYVSDTNAKAFGHRRRGYVLFHNGLLVVYGTDRAEFDAVVLHELAHLRNRDTLPSFLTLAVWRVFLGVVLLPFVASFVVAGLFQDPFDLRSARLNLSMPDAHVAAAVVALSVLVYLTYTSVLRTRETYADATAAIVDVRALDTVIRRRLAEGERRVPEFLDDHPRLWRRVRDLHQPARLSATDATALFGAGLGVSVISVNLWAMAWFAILVALVGQDGRAAALFTGATQRAGPGVVLTLIVFGPGSLLSLWVISRFAYLNAWRARLAQLSGAPRASTVRAAAPMVAGLVLGEPMSLLYANAGVWGFFDVSPAWSLVDAAASTLILATMVLVVCRLARESAALWIPATTGSLRRMCTMATVAGVVGAAPAYFTWNIAHSTLLVSRFERVHALAPLTNWFASDWAFTAYRPLDFLVALPATGLLFAVPGLFFVIGASRRLSVRPPHWLPSALGSSAGRLSRARPRLPLATIAGAGLGTAALAVALGIVVMVLSRLVLGGDTITAAFRYGGPALMEGWLMWLTAIVATVAALLVARRVPTLRLTTALLTVFVATVWASALLPVPLYLGLCGRDAFACASGQTYILAVNFAAATSVIPVDAGILAVVALGVAAAVTWLLRRGGRLESSAPGIEPAGRQWTRYAGLAVLAATTLVSAGSVYIFFVDYFALS